MQNIVESNTARPPAGVAVAHSAEIPILERSENGVLVLLNMSRFLDSTASYASERGELKLPLPSCSETALGEPCR